MSGFVIRAFLPLLLLAAIGCGQKEEQDGPPERTVPVETVTVEPTTIRETVQGIGTLTALKTVEIKPEVSGFVREIGFEGSMLVEEGAILYALSRKKLERRLRADQAALESARSRLKLARRTFARRKELVEKQLVSEEQFDQAHTELTQAAAQVERLQAEIALIDEQIADTVLRAPFSGQIAESLVDTGDFVDVGDHMATLYLITILEMEFTLPERYSGRIRAGQPVEVQVTAFPERTFEGEVDYVGPAVEETTRDFKVKARIDNLEGVLKPGSFGQALVVLETLRERPVIPEESLVPLREGYMVFVVEDGVARRRNVKIGLRDPGRVEIREGLQTGEVVVRTGHMQLTDGAPVRIAGRQASE